MYSPWGKVQRKEKIEIGIVRVYTASHGGILISRVKAEKLLTNSALKNSILWNNYYCFEEDCAVDLVYFELPTIFPKAERQQVCKGIAMYYPNYLKERLSIV